MLNERASSNLSGDGTKGGAGKGTSHDDPAILALRDGLGRLDLAPGRKDYTVDRPAGKNPANKRELDRFVPSRSASLGQDPHNGSAYASLAAEMNSPDASFDVSHSLDQSTASLSATLGVPASNRRILSFRAAPPASASTSSHLDAQRNHLLHATGSSSRGTTIAGPAAAGQKRRVPPTSAHKVLDAPGFVDDYYLNLVDWSCANRVAVALQNSVYVWDAQSGSVDGLQDVPETNEVNIACSVSWSDDGAYLAVGRDSGVVEIWDVEENKKMRVMGGHAARVPSLSWHGHVLSSGCRDGSIYHHDVRVSKHKVMELQGHTAEVCGLTWRADGQLLASGGNDNAVHCWDGRVGQSIMQSEDGVPRGTPKWTKRNHSAAVKALAWCPWQTSLLATGGGSADKHIHLWNSSTGARTHSLPTESQVTSLLWSPHAKELLSSHGYPNHNLILWSYPGMQKIYDIAAHDQRILASAISPDGCEVATVAADENLKFWKIWEERAVGKKSVSDSHDSRIIPAGRIR